MRILFANHTSAWSGGEVSMMRVVESLRAQHVVWIACPDDGALAHVADRAGIERLSLPAVDASLRLHPLQTPAGLAQLAAGGLALARAARRADAEVIHANSSRTGILGALARARGGPAYVVRAHEHVPLTKVGRAVRALIVKTAGGVAAVSDYTATRFNEGLAQPVAKRVYNSIDHARFRTDVTPAPLREQLGLGVESALLGQVAQITPWKGQDVAIRTLAQLRRDGLDAHLVLVGEVVFGGKGVRYDNHAYLRSLEELAQRLRVSEAVHFLGRRDDAPNVLRALDLSLLPSQGEPFGLVTVESLAVGTPTLVSSDGAGPELVEDGVTGRTLPQGDVSAWVRAVGELLRDPEALRLMGQRGPAASARFRDEVHAGEMLAAYEVARGAVPKRSDSKPEASPWPS